MAYKAKKAYLAGKGYLNNNKMVLNRDDSSPIRLAYPTDKLASLIKKHNLHEITVHGLRHTPASLWFEAGVSIKEVQEWLGHSDIQMMIEHLYTRNRYS